MRLEPQILACRIVEVRRELYGEHGGPLLAKALDLPFRTWANYEAGVIMPGHVMLGFLEVTGVNPRWLLDGESDKYLNRVAGGDRDLGSKVVEKDLSHKN